MGARGRARAAPRARAGRDVPGAVGPMRARRSRRARVGHVPSTRMIWVVDAACRIALSGAYSSDRVPGARGVRVGELHHDAALPRPRALEHLDGAAARDEPSAVVGHGVRVAAAVLLQRGRVAEVTCVGDHIGGHRRNPGITAAGPAARRARGRRAQSSWRSTSWPRISPPGDVAVWTFAYATPARSAVTSLSNLSASARKPWAGTDAAAWTSAAVIVPVTVPDGVGQVSTSTPSGAGFVALSHSQATMPPLAVSWPAWMCACRTSPPSRPP